MKNLLVLSMICGLSAGLATFSSAQLSTTEHFRVFNFTQSYQTVTGTNTFTGDAGTWSVYGKSIDEVLGSNYAPSNDGNWVDLAGTPGPGGISIGLNPSPAGTYVLGFDAFSDNGFNSMQYSVDGVAGSTTGAAQATNGSWTHYTELVTLGSGANYLNFYANDSSNGNDGITNISLSSQPVPEPMQTVLAGAAGLVGFLVIRRRNA